MSMRARKTMIVFCSVTSVATVLYWVLFFGFNQVQVQETSVYLGYERAFPIGDLWMTVLSFIAIVQLVRKRPSAGKWLIATGAVLVYLGCLDTLFDFEQHVYSAINSQMWEEVVINLYSFIFGFVSILYGFKHDRFAVARTKGTINHSM